MAPSARSPYAGYRFPAEVISHAVWLYFRFPLSLRMVEEMLAARGIDVSHETVRQWARKFGQAFANQIRRKLPCPGDKWHLDEVCLIWKAQDQAIDWLIANASPEDIVATSTPHWVFIRTGLKAVMPPFEADPVLAEQ